MNTDNSIIRNLIKVKLTVCAWTGKIRSDELAAELEAKHSANKGTLAVQILQIPENKTRDITTTMSQMRAMWNNNTLPWEDKGWRVVPVKHYQTLMDDTRRMKQTFEEHVAKLISDYDSMYSEAKERLTKLNLFHADRFPTRDELKDKYGVYIYQNTINDVSDIRADGLNDIQLNEIRDSVRKEYQERITDIISDIILRLREVVVDAIERTTKDPAGVKFATLIKKIENTCDSLNKLNIIGDTRIDNLIKEVLELSKYDPDTLHVSTEDRKTVNTKAKTVLDQLDSFSL